MRNEASRLDLLAQKARKSDREIIRLVDTILRKRAASSLTALPSTVAERRKNIEESVTEIELHREYLRGYNRGETIPEPRSRSWDATTTAGCQSAMKRSSGTPPPQG